MTRLIFGLVGFLTVALPIARADSPRARVDDTPKLFGREVERLVLVSPIVVDRSERGVPFASTMMVRVTPGIFIPVSEDERGVFYQAVNGYRTIRGNGQVGGGLYLSKQKRGVIWVYVGDARVGSKTGVEQDRLPLPASALRGLLTGKAAANR